MIRLFGSNNCETCSLVKEILDFHKTDYEYINAFDDDLQDFCDIYKVDELPHIQKINNDEVILEDRGIDVITNIKQYIKE